MKIIAVSDLHVEKNGYSQLEHITKTPADVLILGGDVANDVKNLEVALEQLKEFKGVKVAYLGNHELSAFIKSESLANVAQNYDAFSEIYAARGIHLLDRKPIVVQGVGIIGNCGWFDSTLYRIELTSEVAATAQRMKRHVYKWIGEDFVDESLKKMQEEYRAIEQSTNKVVIGIHHIFMQEMMRGFNDVRDLFVGSKKYQTLFTLPKVAVGLCGHTHRPGEWYLHGKRILNISYNEQKPYTEIII